MYIYYLHRVLEYILSYVLNIYYLNVLKYSITLCLEYHIYLVILSKVKYYLVSMIYIHIYLHPVLSIYIRIIVLVNHILLFALSMYVV